MPIPHRAASRKGDRHAPQPSRRRSAPTPPIGLLQDALLILSCESAPLGFGHHFGIRTRRRCRSSARFGCRCRVGTAGCLAAPLTEPDLRATHPALWIVGSKRQTKLVRDFCGRVRDTPEVIGWSPLDSEPRIRVRHVDPLPVTAMPDAPPTVGGAGSLSRVSPPLQEMTV